MAILIQGQSCQCAWASVMKIESFYVNEILLLSWLICTFMFQHRSYIQLLAKPALVRNKPRRSRFANRRPYPLILEEIQQLCELGLPVDAICVKRDLFGTLSRS